MPAPILPNLPQQFIILDTEYTAWEGSMLRGWSEPWEAREVVQIAALCVSQAELLIEDSGFSALVRPKQNPILSPYFSALTGIKQSDLLDAIEFSELLRLLLLLCRHGMISIYTWGDGDESALIETAYIQNIAYPKPLNGFKDIRNIFEALGVSVAGYQSGSIYQSLGLPAPGAAHNALSDVRSIFITLRELAGGVRPRGNEVK